MGQLCRSSIQYATRATTTRVLATKTILTSTERFTDYCFRFFMNDDASRSTAANNNRVRRPDVDLTPLIYINAKCIQHQHLKKTWLALLDSGSSVTMINSAYFPFGVVPSKGTPKQTDTTSDVFNNPEEVLIADCKCPEFGSRWIPDITSDVFHARCRYDMIIGRDLLIPMGIIINFNNYTIQWIEHSIPMKES